MKGGDSSGTSETAETPQECNDEEAWPRPRKVSTRNGMCSPTIDFLLMLSSYQMCHKTIIRQFTLNFDTRNTSKSTFS